MTTPTGDTGKDADDRSMAERVIDRVTGRDHEREVDEKAAAAARQDAQDRANLSDDASGPDARAGAGVDAGVADDVADDPDRTSVFRPPAAPSEPVGGEVTGDDVPASSAADRDRPAWPGPSAASSVGQAATPGPERAPVDRDRSAWAGSPAAGSAGADEDAVGRDRADRFGAGADSPVGAAATSGVDEDAAGRNRADRFGSSADSPVSRAATPGLEEDPAGRDRAAWSGAGASGSADRSAPPDLDKDPADRDRAAWAGPTVAGPGAGVGSERETDSDVDSDRSADTDQTSRAIPTGALVTAPASSATSSTQDTPVTSGGSTTLAPETPGASTDSADPDLAVTPVPSATSASSDGGVYRPGDPSVREDYAHADADRRATNEQVDDVKTKDDREPRDDVETVETKDGVDAVGARGGADGAEVTAPSPVTSITGGRRRSEAAPDAVHGVTDVTPDSEWRDLQAQFVDDPEATVNEAATLIERDLAGLRSKLAGGDTEHLRNAFKRYRSLHESLR